VGAGGSKIEKRHMTLYNIFFIFYVREDDQEVTLVEKTTGKVGHVSGH
jgi:hypothetical protein